MAKTQSFADKSKSKLKSEEQSVKCVYAVFDDATQSWKFRQRMVRVKSAAELDALKF